MARFRLRVFSHYGVIHPKVIMRCIYLAEHSIILKFGFKLLFKVEGPLPSSYKPLIWFDGYTVDLKPDGTLEISDNGGHIFTSTVDGLSAGTVYNIWGHYEKGTGSNGVCEVSFDIVGNPGAEQRQ